MTSAIKKLFGYESTDPYVYLVSTKSGDKINGQIAVDVIGFTFLKDWPRAAIFIGKDKFTHDLIMESGVFALNLLSVKQMELVRSFGMRSGKNIDKFEGVEHIKSKTGSPIIKNCVGYADFKVIEKLDLGDHTMFYGLAVDNKLLTDETPLRISYFKKSAPKEWLIELDKTTKESLEKSKKFFDEYAKRKKFHAVIIKTASTRF
ncbi:MAG: flavin reductase [Candidatus Aenigmarchaeota archaeon]|nr:flavin reductase [Candidatus Aenigmarchaeota archaeon]